MRHAVRPFQYLYLFFFECVRRCQSENPNPFSVTAFYNKKVSYPLNGWTCAHRWVAYAVTDPINDHSHKLSHIHMHIYVVMNDTSLSKYDNNRQRKHLQSPIIFLILILHRSANPFNSVIFCENTVFISIYITYQRPHKIYDT